MRRCMTDDKMVPIERTTHGQCVAPAIGAFFAL